MAREALTGLLPPPAAPAFVVPDGAWPAVKRRIGAALPADYKWFWRLYGHGSIDGFLLVFHPLAPRRHSNLAHHALDDPEGWALLSGQSPARFLDPRFPATGGLLPFARSDNGDVLYWKTTGPAEAWTTTAIDPRHPDGRYDHPGGMVDLLAGLLSRTAPADLLSDDFPSAAPRFHPIRG